MIPPGQRVSYPSMRKGPYDNDPIMEKGFMAHDMKSTINISHHGKGFMTHHGKRAYAIMGKGLMTYHGKMA